MALLVLILHILSLGTFRLSGHMTDLLDQSLSKVNLLLFAFEDLPVDFKNMSIFKGKSNNWEGLKIILKMLSVSRIFV